MASIIRNNIWAIIFSLIVHGVLIFLLVASFEWAPRPPLQVKSPNIVKAVAVDASKVKTELDKLKRADEKKKKQEIDRVTKLKREEQKLKKQRAAEEKRLANLKEKSKAEENKRKVEEDKRKVEQENLAKLKKQQAALKEKQAADDKQREAAEKKRQVEKERLAKEKKKQDAIKKQQALEKKKREEEKAQRQKELAEQLAAEEQAQADEVAQREIDKYQVLIRQKLDRIWLKPPGDLKSLTTIVDVRLIPGGDVIDVTVVKSSGNLVFDRSAERAVRKASPLPLPKDPAIAAKLFNFKFEFKG